MQSPIAKSYYADKKANSGFCQSGDLDIDAILIIEALSDDFIGNIYHG